MAQRTPSQLQTQIDTLLADNASQDISPSDVRSVHTDTKDSTLFRSNNLSDVSNAASALLNLGGLGNPTGNAPFVLGSGGNTRGDYATDLQRSRSAATQVASGTYATVLGGSGNTASGAIATVCGGLNNTATKSSSTVVGGYNGTASGIYSSVLGGYGNTASGLHSIATGGVNNTVSAGRGAVISGYNNNVQGPFSATIGGTNNTVGVSSESSFMALGYNNYAYGTYAVIVGGKDTSVTGSYSSSINGVGCEVTANHSFVTGKETRTTVYGQIAHASGHFANAGDAQISTLVVRGTTSGYATTNLTPEGGSGYITIPTNTGWFVDIQVIAAESGMGGSRMFHRTCLVNNSSGTVTISSVNTIGTDQELSGPHSWSLTVSADDANNALQIQGSGYGGDVRWVGRVNLTEVSNP